jgi:hypothetical protein
VAPTVLQPPGFPSTLRRILLLAASLEEDSVHGNGDSPKQRVGRDTRKYVGVNQTKADKECDQACPGRRLAAIASTSYTERQPLPAGWDTQLHIPGRRSQTREAVRNLECSMHPVLSLRALPLSHPPHSEDMGMSW